MKRLMIILVVMFLLVVPMVSSFGPHTHNYIINQLKEKAPEGSVLKDCLDGGIKEMAFRSGAEISDTTITKYFTDGGKDYKILHNWNFQQEMMNRAITPDEKCFCWGISCHLTPDSVAHTQAIPPKIKRYRIPNWLLHPLWEKKVDSQLVADHPELMEQSKHMLDIMYISPYGDRYIEIMEDALGSNVDFDVKTEVDNLNWALDGFYDKAYRPRVQDNSLFIIYPIIDKITNSIHFLVGKKSIKDMNSYIDKSTELTLNVFENPGSRYALSPHGFSELQKADEKASFIVPLLFIILIIVSVALPIFLVWKTKKFYWAFALLLVVPIIILGVAIVYIIL